MVHFCCVNGCKAECYPGCGLSFHSIPKVESVAAKWKEIIPGKITKTSVICNKHFKDEDFINESKKRLTGSAVPSIFPKSESNLQTVKSQEVDFSNNIMRTNSTFSKWSESCSTAIHPKIIPQSNTPHTEIFKICRVCMTDSDIEPVLNDLESSFLEVTGTQTHIHDALQTRLPLALCNSCWDDFYRCLAFKENVRRANEALYALVQVGKLTQDNIKRLEAGDDTELVLKDEDDTVLTSSNYDLASGVKSELSEVEDNGVDLRVNTLLVDNQHLEVTKINEQNLLSEDQSIVYYTNSDEYISETELGVLSDDNQPLKPKPANNKAKKQTKTKKPPKKKVLTKTKKKTNTEYKKTNTQEHKQKLGNKRVNERNEIVLKHFTLSRLNEMEQRNEFEKRKLDEFYKNRKYKCLQCYRGFVSQETYDRHVELQHTEAIGRPYKCLICSTYYSRKSLLNKHVLSHYEVYKCKQCEYVIDKRHSAYLHILWHQGQKYECKKCSKIFKRKSTLYNHNRIDHASEFACAQCGYSFASEWGLTVHLRRRHRIMDKDFKAPEDGAHCKECSMTFATDDALGIHQKVSPKHNHVNNRLRNDASARIVREPLLSKGTRQNGEQRRTDVIDPNNVLRPARTAEMRNQNVQCEKCGEPQATFFAYKKHFNAAHPGEKRTLFPRLSKQLLCDHCGKVFRSKAYLRDHMHSHSKLAISCTDCSKSFNSPQAYALHRQTHLGVKYPCKLCGKTFTRLKNRDRHELTVHSGRSIKCDFCDKYFKSKEVQKVHIEHVHNNKPWPKRVRNKDGNRTVVRNESDGCIDT